MDTNTGKSGSNQVQVNSSNTSTQNSQKHTSKRPKEEWMNADTKPRKDNSHVIQTVFQC